MASKSSLLKIKLKGGSPWGFRLQGGVGTGLPLVVAKVRRKSKAYNTLKEGDQIITVNDTPCGALTYEQVMTIAEKSGEEINLEIKRKGSRVDNAVPEIKTVESPTPTPSPPKPALSVVTNMEKEKTVTEKQDYKETKIEDVAKTTDVPILLPNFPDPVITYKDPFVDPFPNFESFAKADDKLETLKRNCESPNVISDITVRTSSEITPSMEKLEKLETETFHEKSGNKETTFIRTDFEERTKSNTSSTLLADTIEPSKSEPKTNIETREKEITKNVMTSESYEILKTEKMEFTTTKKTDAITNSLSKDDKSNLSGKNDIKELLVENLPSLDADIMSSLNFQDIFSTTDNNTDSMSITRKKKMFSSSSFYEEPKAIYPTVEEQFEMAKKIAESLADDTNKKSKGANMFFKRAMRSPKWVHEGPEPSIENLPETFNTFPSHWPSPTNETGKQPLKLVLDPRHAIDLASLRSTGHNISEHNVVSPDVCHELVRGLESPAGKGSALFAKRKKKSSEWIVDEEKVKSMMRAQEQELGQLRQNINKAVPSSPGLYLSQWDNYYKSPTKMSGGTNKLVNPDKLAETVIKAADIKRRDSIQSLPEEQLFETCRSPIITATPAASYYDIYRARAPKGWSGPGCPTPGVDNICSSPILRHTDTHSTPAYSTGFDAFPKKYHFQNFNTVPRKWKTQY